MDQNQSGLYLIQSSALAIGVIISLLGLSSHAQTNPAPKTTITIPGEKKFDQLIVGLPCSIKTDDKAIFIYNSLIPQPLAGKATACPEDISKSLSEVEGLRKISFPIYACKRVANGQFVVPSEGPLANLAEPQANKSDFSKWSFIDYKRIEVNSGPIPKICYKYDDPTVVISNLFKNNKLSTMLNAVNTSTATASAQAEWAEAYMASNGGTCQCLDRELLVDASGKPRWPGQPSANPQSIKTIND